MIKAMIFDLDGTLVQTEKLKARSYAKAAVELCPYELDEEEVVEAFKDVVGQPRRQVAIALVDRFDLTEKASQRLAEFGVSSPWQAFAQVRLGFYKQMLADPAVIRANQWPHNMALLRAARAAGCKTGLATMSHSGQVQLVLGALALTEAFDFVAARDDVENGKPDPEIYQLVSRELAVAPGDCLVIEDSPSGVQAVLAAGMKVVAVATPFTRDRLRRSALLPDRLIVDETRLTADVVALVVERYREL